MREAMFDVAGQDIMTADKVTRLSIQTRLCTAEQVPATPQLADCDLSPAEELSLGRRFHGVYEWPPELLPAIREVQATWTWRERRSRMGYVPLSGLQRCARRLERLHVRGLAIDD